MADLIPCEACMGTGEIITDWERYLHALPGDRGDEAVADCPECDGRGEYEVPDRAGLEGDHAA